jgi:hypothetical protein
MMGADQTRTVPVRTFSTRGSIGYFTGFFGFWTISSQEISFKFGLPKLGSVNLYFQILSPVLVTDWVKQL